MQECQGIVWTGSSQLGDRKGSLRWFGYVEHKGDADWAKCCVTL